MPQFNEVTCLNNSDPLMKLACHKAMRRVVAAGLEGAISFEDLHQECRMAWLDAAKSYDPAKAQWSTYLVRCLWNRINRYIERHSVDDETLIVSMDACDELKGLVYEQPGGSHDQPEDVLMREEALEGALKRLKPNALAVVRWLMDTPPELLAEFEALRSKAEYARELGISVGSPPAEFNLRFCTKHLLPLVGFTRSDIARLRTDLQKVAQ